MKTLSEKQLAANRANAQKSTGPRTAEGKARAALNSRKHSLTAATVSMLRLEEHGELDNLRADALAHYRPQTSQEIFAVERIAVCQLMMIRGWRLEAGMFIACVDRVLNDDGTSIFRLHADLYPDSEIHTAQNRNYAMAEGFQRMARDNPMWSLVLRYQAQVERQYRRAVEELERLIRQRTHDDSPNEPISDPDPQQNKPEPTPTGEPTTEPELPVSPSLGGPEAVLRVASASSAPPRLGTPSLSPNPDKIDCSLPKNINHEIWRHRLPRQQLRSRRVLRRRNQPRATSGVHLA